jgi:hypothetical protein
MDLSPLERNLRRVRERIANACERVRRDPSEVRLVAVTKYVGPEVARALFDLGVADMGENRLPVAEPKLEALAGLPIRWHWIGRLQTNKVRKVLGHFQEIHSVDRSELVDALKHEIGKQADVRPRIPVFLQANVSGEAAKTGVTAEEAFAMGKKLIEAPELEWVGLMTMAPEYHDPEQTRPVFAALRELRDRLSQQLGVPLPRLSMGMSSDFEVAVEEGATDVRIGSVLFEGLY